LGLAQIGFQTVLSPHFPWLFLLTQSVFTPSYARFRELLIEARENAGLTQWQLAARLKRPQSYVSKFERGERRLDVVEFLDVTKALRIDPLELLRQLMEKPPRKRVRENPA
jgi:ribosome-binding protein aMBF1 (putative translation factor)